MSIPNDHKALVFIGAIAVLGAGVRVVRAAERTSPNAQPALEHQMQAADSAAKSGRPHAGSRSKRSTKSDAKSDTKSDTTHARRAAVKPPADTSVPKSPAERQGWINGRLDLDVATAAQIDSLPGVTPTMAKRIVADRMQRGPFLNITRLRRVAGVGPILVDKLDSLVTFSGTVVFPKPSDTVIARQHRATVVRRPP
jgi:DNA uptake protein ComE-like DNA-binding protein